MEPLLNQLTLRVQQISNLGRNDNLQQQQLPFTPGQLLQGTINAKISAQVFSLDIGGTSIQAESAIELPPGTKLELQVIQTSPQVELKILNDPIAPLLNKSFHLLNTQALPKASILPFTEPAAHLPQQLSEPTRSTLNFYANSLNAIPETLAQPSTPDHSFTALKQQIASLVTHFSASSQPTDLLSLARSVEQAIKTFATTAPSVPTKLPSLLQEFSSWLRSTEQKMLPLSLTTTPTQQTTPTQATLPLDFLPSQEKAVLEQLIQFVQTPAYEPGTINTPPLLLPQADSQKINTPVVKMLVYILTTPSDPKAPPPQSAQATETLPIKEVLTRLGTNLEQLLSTGEKEKATQTLKFALLELNQKIGQTDLQNTSDTQSAVKTIELYQLIQAKLNNDFLFFLPLPFSFLDQGYLLVESDGKQSASEEKKDKTKTTKYSLHLKLQGLGNLIIQIKQQADQVSIIFQTENAEKASFLAEYRDTLQDRLTQVNLESVHFLIGVEEPAKILLKKMLQGQTGMVDTNA